MPAGKCTECGKECKNIGAHVRLAHGKRATGGELLSSAPPSAPTKVRFFSPRAPQLTVVIRPDVWQDKVMSVGPDGTPVVQRAKFDGHRVQFKDGWFETSDPVEIDRLTNYSDTHYPIVRM